MVYCIFGENCTGKKALAEKICKKTGAVLYCGKDYLRLAPSEADAAAAFHALLSEADARIVYVAEEESQLSFLPDTAVKILMTADLEIIKERSAQRMGGPLPPHVEKILERKHGSFDTLPHDYHVHNGMWNELELI